jgi:hemoglobin/transferrin/lactoferrin receptor protein
MKKIYLILVAVFTSALLLAQDNTEQKKQQAENEIVISAMGYKSFLTMTPGGIGILTGEDIQKLDPVSISNAMQGITGVYKASDSSWGSEISIRGTTRDKVILIIDDSRVITSTDIAAQFGTIDPMSVERIEILKGPVSSLYGSGNIGGVVNVVTRNGKFTETPGFKSGISVSGDYLTSGYNTYAFTSYNSPGWYVFSSGSYRDHDDYRDGDGNKVKNSGFKDGQGAVNLGFKLSPNHIIEIHSQYYEGQDIGIPGARNNIPLTASSAEYTILSRGLFPSTIFSSKQRVLAAVKAPPVLPVYRPQRAYY